MTTISRALAEAIGLGRLSDEQLQQLERSSTALQRHVQRLPRDLPVEREPELVFRVRDAEA